jgi:putative transposase
MLCCRFFICAASRPAAFREALAALLGKDAPSLSPSVIGRLKEEWQVDYDRWQRRELSARRYVYIWADGV